MTRFMWVLGFALLLAAGSRFPAAAQVVGDMELARNWNLRLGLFVPTHESARAKEGDVWLNVGAERDVYTMERGILSMSVEYYGSGSLYNIPIMLNARTESQRIRLGAGAGVGISHALFRGQTGFAYNFLVGYVVQQGRNPITADIRYMGLSVGSGVLDGLSFTLGFHF